MIVAVDIGGTKILAALVSLDGEVIRREYSLTKAEEGRDAVVSRVLSSIEGVIAKNRDKVSVDQVVIAAAGAINTGKGVITVSPNIPGWDTLPLKDIAQEKLNIETYLINDANAAALGEFYYGAGRGSKNMVYLTVSTGIGGGIIINGKLYEGTDGGAGEIGHMTIDVNGPLCSCGNYGCFEMLASGKAIAREAIRCIRSGIASDLPAMVSNEVENITAEMVYQAYQRGDMLAKVVILRAATYLGTGLINLVNIFNPDKIIIGGGVSRMGETLLGPARYAVRERAMKLPAGTVDIIQSQLGSDAGVVGAAAFVRTLPRRKKVK